MRIPALVCSLLVTTAGVAAPVSAHAQQDSMRAVLCARAEAWLQSRDYQRALPELLSCPVDGPRRIAELWRTPTSGVPLYLLGEVSAMVQDQRVFDAARAVVANEGAPRDARLAGMKVLVGHYDPCLGVAIEVSPQPGPPIASVIAAVGENEYNMGRKGSVPLVSSVRENVLSTLDRLASSDPDGIVREAARRVARQLRHLSAVGTRC